MAECGLSPFDEGVCELIPLCTALDLVLAIIIGKQRPRNRVSTRSLTAQKPWEVHDSPGSSFKENQCFKSESIRGSHKGTGSNTLSFVWISMKLSVT